MNETKLINFPCHLWQGFIIYLILFVVPVSANPTVGSSIKRNADNYSITIYTKSAGSILNGDIYCEYDPQYDIDKASIRSPISALSLGASLNSTVYSLHITIASRNTVTLDSAVIAVLEIPFSGISSNDYAFKIDSASFTDRSGVKRKADIIPVSIIIQPRSIMKSNVINSNHFYMLNGRKISQNVIDNYRRESSGGVVPLKILYLSRRN